MLHVIGSRVLIRPLENPTQTDSGLHLVEHRKPECMGEVVSVGEAVHPLKDVAEDLATRLERDTPPWDDANLHADAATLLRDLTRKEPSVTAGDVVVFSWAAGQELLVNDTRYLLLPEADILAVLEDAHV
jgi:co-chaperonin GroES (HSP10)